MRNIYARILERLRQGKEALLVTTCRSGRTTKTLHDADAAGGGEAPRREGLRVAEDGDGLILTERFFPKTRLIILGAGHIALPLAKMGEMLHFETVVFDDRPSFANRERFPGAGEVVCDYFDNMAERLSIRSGDFVAIVTRGHKYDQDCLRAIVRGEMPSYLGMIGSRRRVGIVLRQLREEGCAPENLARLHAPIGLDIGAVTPEEIALAILAEMVRERRNPAADPDMAPCEATDMKLLEWLAGKHAEKAAVVTVLSVRGSAPRNAGAKMAVLGDGRVIGSIGGGCVEADVIREARRILNEGGYCRKVVDLTDAAEENGMVCGGVMDVLIEAMA
ncbi:MAG: XdhC family protein [Desulfovibrio sp.]|jgi:xanthine dehydrogenase accessory factor|nr:XdhC family protein [Desulfovibrio sp.]